MGVGWGGGGGEEEREKESGEGGGWAGMARINEKVLDRTGT